MGAGQGHAPKAVNTPRQILFASLIGTAIEFFDFYIYATAAVLVFPALFFPASDPATATLASLATFAIAFLARPVGSALFGHFGDRVGRKTTLVAALLTMGLSTVAIGVLPPYQSIGIAAPVLLALCRFGQGLGLGGEWGGAVLLATENAPPGRRAWYGMFPQLGAPLGFFCSGGIFLVLSRTLTDAQFFAWGWRVPFLASAVLVLLGLYVRLSITETPIFAAAVARHERVQLPMLAVLRSHAGMLVIGTLIGLSVYVNFYLMTVFALSWGTSQLGYTREQFLFIQLFGVLFFRRRFHGQPSLAERGRRPMLMWVNVATFAFGWCFPALPCGRHRSHAHDGQGPASWGWRRPLGTVLAELFRRRFATRELAHLQPGGHLRRVAGAVCRHMAATNLSLQCVGYYLSAATLLSLLGLWMSERDEGPALWDRRSSIRCAVGGCGSFRCVLNQSGIAARRSRS
jgi:MFS family permease